ncbi:MAG: metal ABC transporter ATP-binding protein [Oscillospiraceae bacterium]|nr:metal ABC transporter ATP-binding protein [Oscillospiraceae bacterium]
MISAKGLYFSYTGTSPYILSGMDFDIFAGEYISVVGDNGSGKTTLMRLILKMIKPSSGLIVSSAKRTGYVPQRNNGADSGFPITVYEMLNAYRKLLNVKDKDAVSENLSLVGMHGFENALTKNLSGGQRQKTLIARALMGEPDLLVLDEPSTGIDATSRRDIYRILKALNQTKGMTIISVEHNLMAAISNSTRIYHLAGGHGHICTPEQYVAEYMKRPEGFGDA